MSMLSQDARGVSPYILRPQAIRYGILYYVTPLSILILKNKQGKIFGMQKRIYLRKVMWATC